MDINWNQPLQFKAKTGGDFHECNVVILARIPATAAVPFGRMVLMVENFFAGSAPGWADHVFIAREEDGYCLGSGSSWCVENKPIENDEKQKAESRNEILPCPFCGSSSQHIVPFKESPSSTVICCLDCGAAIGGEENPTREQAITAWNRRAPAPVSASVSSVSSVVKSLEAK